MATDKAARTRRRSPSATFDPGSPWPPADDCFTRMLGVQWCPVHFESATFAAYATVGKPAEHGEKLACAPLGWGVTEAPGCLRRKPTIVPVMSRGRFRFDTSRARVQLRSSAGRRALRDAVLVRLGSAIHIALARRTSHLSYNSSWPRTTKTGLQRRRSESWLRLTSPT